MKRTHRINDLAQVRLLSDPLKLRLLHAFAEGPRTTKQVADELGANVTRLYRHVDALKDGGLLEIVGEKQKRGAVERTFRAIAERFEVDHALFTGESARARNGAIRELLSEGVDEILGAFAGAESGRDKPLLVRLRCKASPARVAELRRLLADWIEAAQEEEDDDSARTEEAGALIAFYSVGNRG